MKCAACKALDVGPEDHCFGCGQTICYRCCGSLGHYKEGPHALSVIAYYQWENLMAKKRKKAAAAPEAPAPKVDPIVCEWHKTDPMVMPMPVQFTARQLSYLNTMLAVQANREGLEKDRVAQSLVNGTLTAVNDTMRAWWDQLEKVHEGTWTVKTAFSVAGASSDTRGCSGD